MNMVTRIKLFEFSRWYNHPMWDAYKHHHALTHSFTKRDMLVEIIRIDMQEAMDELMRASLIERGMK